VAAIANHFTELEIISSFKGSSHLLVAGSTWPEDEQLLKEALIQVPQLKLIIAPHEIHKEHIKSLLYLFPEAITYSEVNSKNINDHKILIINNVGMLSRLYYYASITYIGGGFNKSGIHNTLEAAVWGKPVFFGPNYQKFKEARDLVQHKAAFSVTEWQALRDHLITLLSNETLLNSTSQKSKAYVLQNTGATAIIMDYIRRTGV
jgi:3-deoxy-D-manno-octulosonic-acid transferase